MMIIFLGLLFLKLPAFAAVQTWDIKTPSQVVTQDRQLVVNKALGELHPSLFVVNYQAGFTPYYIDVGQGQHGAFDSSTYANFSRDGDVSGNIIRLDTNKYPVLNVTNFYLAQGWIIDVVGDQPLIINSLTNIQVAGEIWCHGDPGGDASLTQAGLGGKGRCGGSDGGDGGDTTSAAKSAQDRGLAGGGKAGSNSAAEMHGGGGGAWNDPTTSTAGANANNGFGDAGTTVSDPDFTHLLGSAGGGGGGTGVGNQPGAGGGGGGGLVVLHAVQDIIFGIAPSSVFGKVRIAGGNGGAATATTGGAGGGGGGGSLQVFAGRDIELYNTVGTGVVDSQSAVGGNSGAGSGGNGGRARNWFSSYRYNTSGTGFYNPAEEAPVTPGVVEFTTSSQFAESTSLDLKNTLAQIQGVTIEAPGTATSWMLSGSDDDFQSDNTGWTNDLALVNSKRYMKIRVELVATNVHNPEKISSVKLLYSPGSLGDFDFESASCAMVKGSRNRPSGTGSLLFLLPFAVIFWIRRSQWTVVRDD